MVVTGADISNIYAEYLSANKTLSQYSINLPEGVNELDPLLLLECINGENSISNKAMITSKLIEGKKVEMLEGEKKILGFTFNGEGQLSMLFTSAPYLLQALLDFGYAHVLKKLTPPSPASSGEVSVEKK